MSKNRAAARSFELSSPDPERLVAFYHQILGIELTPLEEGGPNPSYAGRHHTTALRIHHRSPTSEDSSSEVGPIRLAFEVEDPEGLRQALEQARAEVRSADGPLSGSPAGPMAGSPAGPAARGPAGSPRNRWSLVARDPDGNIVLFSSPPDSAFAGLQQRLGEVLPPWLDPVALRANFRAKVVDRLRYALGHLTIYERDLRPYTHLVTSREGLYAVSREGFTKVLPGLFFGLTYKDGAFYCFEALDHVWLPSFRGRVVRLALEDGQIHSAEVVLTGLDNGCHQIDFIAGRLHIVDTYNQRVLRFDEDLQSQEELYPIPEAPRFAHAKGYRHMNSITTRGDDIYLLLSHGIREQGMRSEVVRTDRDFQIEERFLLPGKGCHDLLFLEDGTLLSCDSAGGSIIDREGTVAWVGEMLTRGLSVGDDEVVVGDSFYAVRVRRRYAPGNIYFYDRSFELQARLSLPAAPTEIRRIDGRDLALADNPR